MVFSQETLHPRTEHAQYAIRELFPVAEKLEKAGATLAKVNIGDPVPYFSTPKYIREAYAKAILDGKTGYGRSPGEKPFIDAIGKRHRRLYGADYPDGHIFVTQGVSEAISFLNTCLMGKGRGALLFKPYYPTYAPDIRIHEGTPVLCSGIEEEGWAPDLDDMRRQAKKAKVDGISLKYMLLINPCNPTGALWGKKDLEQVAEFAKDEDLLVVSDEIYDQMVFGDAKFVSMAQVAKGQPHVILNGLSKVWCASGFRIGWMLLGGEGKPMDSLADAVMRLGTLRLCPSIPAQHAGIEALENVKAHNEFLRSFVPELARRSNYCLKGLNSIPGVSCQPAKGAFYLFPKVDVGKAGCRTDVEFTRALLEREKVWAVQGSGFGLGGHLRLVTLPTTDVLDAACDGIARMMAAKGN